MDQARDRALSNDLIRNNVARHIKSPATLAICARMNRRWYEDAVPILWKGTSKPSPWMTPDVGFLAELALSPERFRFYMTFVRHLYLTEWGYKKPPVHRATSTAIYTESLWSTLRPLSIFINAAPDLGEKNLACLLKPSLLSLSLDAGYYTDITLSAIKTTAPRLESLFIDLYEDDIITSAGLHQFLIDMPQLRSLYLWRGFEKTVTKPVMLQLMAKDNLDHVELTRVELKNSVISQASAAIPHIQSLKVGGMAPKVARKVFPQMAQLRKLDIWADRPMYFDLSEDILLPLSHCSCLADIKLNLDQTVVLEKEHLAAFAEGCPRLRSIKFHCCHDDPSLDFSEAEEGTLASLTTRLPELEKLLIDLHCRAATWEISDLAHSCPQLRELKLNARFDLSKLSEVKASGVVFPVLEAFEFSRDDKRNDNPTRDHLSEPTAAQIEQELDAMLPEIMPALQSIKGGIGFEWSVKRDVLARLNETLEARAPEPAGRLVPVSLFLRRLQIQMRYPPRARSTEDGAEDEEPEGGIDSEEMEDVDDSEDTEDGDNSEDMEDGDYIEESEDSVDSEEMEDNVDSNDMEDDIDSDDMDVGDS